MKRWEEMGEKNAFDKLAAASNKACEKCPLSGKEKCAERNSNGAKVRGGECMAAVYSYLNESSAKVPRIACINTVAELKKFRRRFLDYCETGLCEVCRYNWRLENDKVTAESSNCFTNALAEPVDPDIEKQYYADIDK